MLWPSGSGTRTAGQQEENHHHLGSPRGLTRVRERREKNLATAQTCSRRKGLLPGSPSLLLVSCDKLLQMVLSTPVKCLSDKEAKLWTMAAGLPTPGNHLTLCLLPNLLQSYTNTHSSLKALHEHGPLDGLEVGRALTTGKGWPRRMNSCRRTFCRTSPLNCTIPQSLQKAHTRVITRGPKTHVRPNKYTA